MFLSNILTPLYTILFSLLISSISLPLTHRSIYIDAQTTTGAGVRVQPNTAIIDTTSYSGVSQQFIPGAQSRVYLASSTLRPTSVLNDYLSTQVPSGASISSVIGIIVFNQSSSNSP